VTEIALLPGMDGTGLLFAPFAEALTARGHQPRTLSYPYDEPMSMDMLARQMWEIIGEAPPPVILGESYGSQIVLRLLRDHPDTFRAAIFVGGFGERPTSLLWLSRFLPVSWSFRIPRPRWVLRTFTYDGQTDEAMLDTHIRATRAVAPEVMADRIENMARMQPIARTVDVPVLYLAGSHDRLVPPRNLAYFRNYCPDLEIETPARCHMIVQTEPERCADLVSDFLARRLGGSV